MDVDEPVDENPKQSGDFPVSDVPDEFLLGSITTNALLKEEKGVQIRSSARVFKKMKLEQEQDKKHEEAVSQEATLVSPSGELPVMVGGVGDKSVESEGRGLPLRSSTRVVKKAKFDAATPVTDAKTKKEEPVKTDIKKEVRKWSYIDKLIFFEAVNEFGKDFESIQHYINAKLKKKNCADEQMKNKDHVRSFFIRTFHEVAKHVKFSENVKKIVQELYGVINYGELYRKLGVVSDKTLMKLNELIYRGETCVRTKGKNVRIKTPMCKALVKLNQLDDKYEEVKLPNRVTVELRPKDMTSFLTVQCLAQNPRLKTTLPIQKRLSSLIQCLSKRWRSVDAMNYEKATLAENPMIEDCMPTKKELDEKMTQLVPPLRLSPPPEIKIELPSINLSEYFSRQTICLTAYESRLSLDTYSEIKKLMSKRKKTKLETEPKPNDAEPKTDIESKIEIDECVLIEQIKSEEIEAGSYFESEPDALLADAVHDAVNTILSLQSLERQLSESSEPEEKLELPVKAETVVTNQVNSEDLEQIEKVRKGWTEATSESLTVGEIYLMYGSDAKLVLEYSWDGNKDEEVEKPKPRAANFLEMWNESYETSWENKQRNMTSSLSKLLSLAKLHFRQNNVKCPCGHVCSDKPIKSSTIIGGQRIRKGTFSEGASMLNNSKQPDTGQMGGANEPPLENNQTQGVNNVFKSPSHTLTKGLNVQAPTMQQQLNTIQKFKPKFAHRKGRQRQPLVVERKLPLMPNNLSGHQIVRMSIISQEPPVEPKTESANPNSEQGQEEPDLQRIITDPDEEDTVISTVPPSPTRLLKEGETDWISAEVADYSLSSLLGHLESPSKAPLNLNSNMASDLSSEVDAQLRSLMTENSMDFAANFADLASVVSDRKF